MLARDNLRSIAQIYLGVDHAAVAAKSFILSSGVLAPYQVEDLGAYDTQSVDYPVYAYKVCRALQDAKNAVGILMCGSGVGMCIAANRYPWIRAAIGNHSDEEVRLAREHNDANVVCLGARLLTETEMAQRISVFLTTAFAGGRHERRVQMLGSLA